MNLRIINKEESNEDSAIDSNENMEQVAYVFEKDKWNEIIEQEKKNEKSGIIFKLLTAVCVIALVVEFGMIENRKSFIRNAGRTQAVISYVVDDSDADGNYGYYVYVDYSVEGKNYKRIYLYKDHSVREPQLGTSLNIYYKKSNPSIISDGTIYDSSIVSSIVFTLLVGLIFLCFCIQIKKGRDVSKIFADMRLLFKK